MITVYHDGITQSSWFLDFTPGMKCRESLSFLQSMGAFSVNENYRVERNNFNTVLVVYTLSGTGNLVLKNQKHTLKKDDVFIIDCNQYHCYFADPNENWEFEWIHFDGINKGIIDMISEGGVIYKSEKIKVIIDKIQGINKAEIPNREIHTSLYLTELCTEFMLLSREKLNSDASMPPVILTAINYMEENYTKKVVLDELCKTTNISKYYFCRLFKKHMQCSPYEYLLNYKIAQAKHFLRTTTLSVEETAEKTGFNSASHFIKCFQQRENTTPLKYKSYYLIEPVYDNEFK